jgi:alkanesulfonate monooxygenase SsuD/methylene tetrahydromethanopterin reductase-like flavin-dependent oxidoreductase (luciferase family)
VRVGITLPQFRDDPDAAIEVARHAEGSGLDGVFVFDHLWPIGQPDRPAIHSQALLGALAVETSSLALGTLVARVGLLPDAVLVHALDTANRVSGGRVIAGLGTGDHLSRAENIAYGVPFAPVADRLAALERCAVMCREKGMPTWVGGRSPRTREVAVRAADAWNLWGAPAEDLAAERDVPVTWGGQVRPDDDLAVLLAGLAGAGATWAVLAPVEFEWAQAVTAIASAAGVARQ